MDLLTFSLQTHSEQNVPFQYLGWHCFWTPSWPVFYTLSGFLEFNCCVTQTWVLLWIMESWLREEASICAFGFHFGKTFSIKWSKSHNENLSLECNWEFSDRDLNKKHVKRFMQNPKRKETVFFPANEIYNYMNNNSLWFVCWKQKKKKWIKYLYERPEALCCPYFHTPTLYSIFLVAEPYEDEGSLGWAGEHPHCTGAHRSPLRPNNGTEEHKRAEIPGLPGKRLHYAHSPAPSGLKTMVQKIILMTLDAVPKTG